MTEPTMIDWAITRDAMSDRYELHLRNLSEDEMKGLVTHVARLQGARKYEQHKTAPGRQLGGADNVPVSGADGQ